jgi:hypothetical protein
MKLFRRHKRAGPSCPERRPAVTDGPLLRLVTLAAVVDRACELQDRADAVLFLCSLPGEPASALAREGGYVAGEYYRLHSWSLDVEDTGPLGLQVSQLLMYHCHVVHHAVRIAFPKSVPSGSERRRGIAPELGDAGHRLRVTRTEIADRIRVLERA